MRCNGKDVKAFLLALKYKKALKVNEDFEFIIENYYFLKEDVDLLKLIAKKINLEKISLMVAKFMTIP